MSTYRGYSNVNVYLELEQLAKEVGLVQINPDELNCGACTKPLVRADSIHRVPIPHKRALNRPAHEDGSAIAYICGTCKEANAPIIFTFHREKSGRERCIEINVDDLPDKQQQGQQQITK